MGSRREGERHRRGGMGMDVDQARRHVFARASIVSAASPAILASTAAMRPAEIATSRTSLIRGEGSMTCPPLMMRSWEMSDELLDSGLQHLLAGEVTAAENGKPDFDLMSRDAWG
jgi:hypothetical protein